MNKARKINNGKTIRSYGIDVSFRLDVGYARLCGRKEAMRRRKSPLEKLEEMEGQRQALMEFKKAFLEEYIKTPMGKLTIWMLDKFEKFLNRRKG